MKCFGRITWPRGRLRPTVFRNSKGRGAFLAGRGLVDTIEQWRCLGLERFGGGDIRLDHEFFDELMRIEAIRRDDTFDEAMRVEDEFALREIEFERLAALAAFHQNVIGPPERPQDRLTSASVLSFGLPSIAACASW